MQKQQITDNQRSYNNKAGALAIFMVYFGVAVFGGLLINTIIDTLNVAEENTSVILGFFESLICIILFFTLKQPRTFLLEDIKKVKENPKRFIIYSVILGILFTSITFLAGRFIGIFIINTSENQSTVVSGFQTNFSILAAISSVIFAPFVEELLFRKAIYKGIGNDKVSFYLSIFIFSSIHMLSTDFSSNPKNFVLLYITYLVPSILLNVIYRFFGKNVYMTAIAHFLNNVLAFILVVAAGQFIL